MMEQAPAGFQSTASPETLRKIDRLVAFIDGVIDKEEDVNRHPLATAIRNWAPWNIESLADLSDSMVLAAERARGFNRLRRSLGDLNHYEDAAVELSLAAEFLRARLDVSFVMESKDKRTCDLSIDLDGGKLYVEITRLGRSAETKEAFSFLNREDWRVAEFAGLDVEIRLSKFISKRRLEELVELLVSIAGDVRASRTPRSYTADGLMSANIKNSSAEGKSSFSVNFPLDVDEVARLARTIRRKAAQLPEGYPGMLIIVDNELHVGPWDRPNFSPIIEEVEEYVCEQEHMTGLLIILPFSAAEVQPFASSGENWIAWRKLGPVSLAEDRIFIRNRYADGPVNEMVLSAVGCPVKRVDDPAVSGSS